MTLRLWSRRDVARAGGALGVTALAAPGWAQPGPNEVVTIDLGRDVGPLDHIWRKCIGSDRAAITLRESWRKDLDRARSEIGVERVRFHGIFNDEMGVGTGPNFQNVDEVYDGLLARGVQPWVELGFMPRRYASGTKEFGFYKANVTPPKSLDDWSDFIGKFVRHLIARYGAAEVRRWYFEVWNEPNLQSWFWTGTQDEYFAMYKATALAVKAVDPAIRVGGPATSAVQWIPQFLAYCAANDAPVDFVSTHAYPGDDQNMIFGQKDKYPQYDVIPEGAALARRQIDATKFKGTPLWVNEWSSDSPAMIAHIISRCLGVAQGLSQWELSGAYEENGPFSYVFKEGQNGWNMMGRGNIAKPEFNTYKLLRRLGEKRLAATGPALASSTGSGFAALVWNLVDVQQAPGIPGASATRRISGGPKTITVTIKGARPGQRVRLRYVDQTRGSPYPAWRRMGSPQYPSREQMDQLRQAAEIAPPEIRKLDARGQLTLDLPPEGIALIENA